MTASCFEVRPVWSFQPTIPPAASSEVGTSLVALVELIATLIAADTSLEPLQLWERLRRIPQAPSPQR